MNCEKNFPSMKEVLYLQPCCHARLFTSVIQMVSAGRNVATLSMKIWFIHTLCLGEWFTCLHGQVAKAVWLWCCCHITGRWIKHGYDKNMWFSNSIHFPRLMGTTCIKCMWWLPVIDFFVLRVNPSLKYNFYCVWFHSRSIWRNDASTNFKQMLSRILATWRCKEHFLSSFLDSPLSELISI